MPEQLCPLCAQPLDVEHKTVCGEVMIIRKCPTCGYTEIIESPRTQ